GVDGVAAFRQSFGGGAADPGGAAGDEDDPRSPLRHARGTLQPVRLAQELLHDLVGPEEPVMSTAIDESPIGRGLSSKRGRERLVIWSGARRGADAEGGRDDRGRPA